MTLLKRVVRLTAFLLVLSLFIVNVLCQANEAETAISKVEIDLITSFEAFLEVEKAGITTSQLLRKLNEASELLADAQIRYRNGDFSGAISFAQLANDSLRSLKDEVSEIASSVAIDRVNLIFWTGIGSALGIFLVVLAAFRCWRYIKESYLRRTMEMKPEASEDDES